MTLLILPLMMLQQTGSVALTGAATAMEATPSVLFGLFAGALADRGRQVVLFLGADLLAAVGVGSAALMAAVDVFRPWAIFACAAVIGIGTVFRDAAMFGVLPRLGGAENTAAAVSVTQTTGAVAAILGPLAASGMMSLHRAELALGLDCLGYLLAITGFLGIRRRLSFVRSTSDRSLGHDVLVGLRTVWTRPALRSLTTLVALGSVTGGGVLALIVPITVAELGLDATAPQVGIIMAAGSAGGLVAAATMPMLARRLGPGRLTVAAVGGVSAGALALALGGGLGLIIALYAGWQFAFVIMITNGIAARIRLCPPDMVSRVSMSARLIAWGGQPVGGYLAAALSSRWNPHTSIAVGALIAAAACLVALARRTHRLIDNELRAVRPAVG
jgi:MFS family permease